MNRHSQEKFASGALPILSQRLHYLADHLYASSLADKISSKQLNLLSQLCDNGGRLSISELASWLGSSRQNVKKMAEKLIDLGFIELQINSFDKRSSDLIVTRKGKLAYTRAQKVQDQYLSHLFSYLSDAELAKFCQDLQKLSTHLDELEERSYALIQDED